MTRKTTGRNWQVRGPTDRDDAKRPDQTSPAPEEHWRSILENIPDIVMALDRDGTTLFINRTIPGFSEHDVVGKSAFDFLPPEQHDKLRKALDDVFGAGEVVRYEVQGAGSFGATAWYSTRVGPIMRDGKVVGAAVVATDITEQKRADEALRESREKWRSLIENAPAFVVTVDRDGTILSTNRTVPDFSAVEVVGNTVYTYIPAEYHDRVRQALEDVFNTGNARRIEIAGVGPGGAISWYEVRLGSIVLNGKVASATWIATDITDHKRAEDELRQSERRYRDLVEDINEVIYELDASGRFTYVSPAVEQVGGYSPSEMIGRPFTEFVHPDDASNLVQRFRRDQMNLLERANEYRTITKSGETVWVRSHGRVISEGGGVAGYRGILVDITDHKRAEEALRESDERFRSAFEHAATGMALVAPDGRLLQANRACWETLGYSEQELTSTTWQALTHPDDLETTLAHVRLVLAGDSPSFRLEKRFIHKDGRALWGDVTSSLVRDGEGTPLYFITQIQDITERRQAEEALRVKEETIRALLNAPSESAVLAEPDGTILALNEIAAQRLGKSVEDLVGVCLFDLLPPEVAAGRKAKGDEVVRSGKPVRFEDCRGGIWFDSTIYPIFDAEGDVVRLAIFATDITETKEMEVALEQAREELVSKVERRFRRGTAYGLSFRQLTVLHLVAIGMGDKEIGTLLGISSRTAGKHVGNILAKMGAASRTEAGVRAVKERLVG